MNPFYGPAAGIGLRVANSLSKEAAMAWIKKNGVQAFLAAWQAVNAYREGQATSQRAQTARQKEQAYEAIEKAIPTLLERVQPKEINIISGAFNSTAPFLNRFESAALIAIPLLLLDLNNAIKLVGRKLEAIRNELAIANVARVQGWEKDGFGAHVYRFIRNEMFRVANEDRKGDNKQRHYFYVWNPDTDWYPVFEEMNRATPLGPNFGGYNKDLGTVCLRMRTDREALIQTNPHGRTAMFHLLIPSYQPIVIENPIAFHENILPLTVTGQRHRDVDFVWFNLYQTREVQLNCIGQLKEARKTNYIVIGGLAIGLVTCITGGIATGFAGVATLPFVSLAGEAASLGFWSGTVASYGAIFGGIMYDELTSEGLKTLGDAILLPHEI
ncbi:hypothetical protein BJY04DRAFT_222402 [Aspergillus karnatakaensis]|uniref:uncharacterized protein n=1 Tax=Aspergillus karnatakaensis TaxID=1810916 RepID=UPI003CCCFDF5